MASPAERSGGPGDAWDVVVVGSGGPGLTAALAASARGAKVALLEATPAIGGTTVFSGGQVWVPGHHRLSELGVSDSREEALAYLRASSPTRGGAHDEARWAAFVDAAPAMIRFLEERTPLRFLPNDYPDSFVELPGGKRGRNLEARPFRPGRLQGRRADLRKPCSINRTNLPVTWQELRRLVQNLVPEAIRLGPRVLYRLLSGSLTGSRALVAGLYAGCLREGVEVILGARARELLTSDGEVCGVVAERAGERVAWRARGGVILASGGFDWSPELKEKYLPGRLDHSAAVPSNRGDGLRMALQVGAQLAHLDEAWYWPGFRNPGYFYQGAPLGSIVTSLRSYPHGVVVNRSGRRFGNEAGWNFGNELQARDERTGERVNLPCWVILDAQFRRRYSAPEAGLFRFLPARSWVQKFASLDELAGALGIDPTGLRETLERFNANARQGRDPDFARGESECDRFYGARRARHPNLGAVEQAPFYAVELVATAVGTKGGPLTTERGEVLRADGAPIPGLYAVGSVADSILGVSVSGGDTLGPGLTAGYVAGNAAALRAG